MRLESIAEEALASGKEARKAVRVVRSNSTAHSGATIFYKADAAKIYEDGVAE